MGYESPLYGRRTGQLLLKQISFIHTLDYIENFEKAGFVPVESENAYYMVFAKSFRRWVEDEDVTVYDLEDMKRLFMAQ